MFGNTDLPLALIMEEILEWEKKPRQETEEDEQDKADKQKNSRVAGF